MVRDEDMYTYYCNELNAYYSRCDYDIDLYDAEVEMREFEDFVRYERSKGN